MIIHIVNGYSAFASLKYTLYDLIQPKDNLNHVIINHCDDLSIGPLFDVDTVNVISRKTFWQEILLNDYDMYYPDLLLLYNDLNKLKVTTNATIILWYGYNATEILMTRRVAWYLHNNANIKVDEVVLPAEYFNDTSFQNEIAMVPPKELHKLYKKAREISTNTLKSWAQEWDIIRNIPNCIRIWRNNNLETVPETFFDDALLDLIDNNWVLSTKIVGEVMGRSFFRIRDTWLFLRLRYLIDIGILETQQLPTNMQKMHPPQTIYIRRIK